MAYKNSSNIDVTGVVSADGVGDFSGRTITGTTDFVDIADGDGISANPTISINSKFETTGMHGWNGSILEVIDVVVTSDGATITCAVEKTGGGNLTVVFSDGYYAWTTAPDTVTLTAGSDASPTLNYVYLLQSTKTLTASTVGWPATEYAAIATVICESAPTLATKGAYKVHAWTDKVVGLNDIGQIADIDFWIRHQEATWTSGVLQTYTITPNGGAADNVTINTTSGIIFQLHDHTFPAFAGGHDYYVVNDSVTPYNIITDLNALLTDSTGASMSGKYFSLVMWGVVSEATGDCKIFINLPGGSYNTASNVTADPDKYADFSIPADYVGTGFLISQWNLRHNVAASGTWTSIDELDLRGLLPSISPGGTTAAQTQFADNTFRIFDEGDGTKQIAFEASAITTATTRTITSADYDIDMAALSNSFPTDSGTATPALGVLTVSGGGGIVTSASGSTVTISGTGGGVAWQVIGASQTLAVDNGYFCTSGGALSLALPATSAVGEVIEVTLDGSTSWVITQPNAGTQIRIGSSETTVGVTGTLTSSAVGDTIKMICQTTDARWQITSMIGNITVV